MLQKWSSLYVHVMVAPTFGCINQVPLQGSSITTHCTSSTEIWPMWKSCILKDGPCPFSFFHMHVIRSWITPCLPCVNKRADDCYLCKGCHAQCCVLCVRHYTAACYLYILTPSLVYKKHIATWTNANGPYALLGWFSTHATAWI